MNNNNLLVKSPKISVITVCYNAASCIEQTIQSVVSQSYENVEYLVIDGGSTDGTLDIIDKYRDHIDYFVSEPDKGIYDAMNKGIKAATGDWINFMNAGDRFVDFLILDKIANVISNYSNIDICYGDAIHKYSFGDRLLKSRSLNGIRKSMVFSHQSCLIRTNIMKENLFDLKYHLAADYNFLLTMYIDSKHFLNLDFPVSIVLVEDGATASNFAKSKKEVLEIHKERCYPNWLAYKYYFQEITRFKIVKIIKALLPNSIKRKIIKDESSNK